MTMNYDILLRGGHLIDPKNDRDSIMDLAIKDGKVAAVGPSLSGLAEKTVDISGLYITPAWSTSTSTSTAASTPGSFPTPTACPKA